MKVLIEIELRSLPTATVFFESSDLWTCTTSMSEDGFREHFFGTAMDIGQRKAGNEREIFMRVKKNQLTSSFSPIFIDLTCEI